MIIDLIAILTGLVVLVWSADRFVYAAAGIAVHLGMSTLMIGLTIVAFGTSAPEIFVSTLASLAGNPGLAIGNAIGSNIANVGLVLGITLMMGPIVLPAAIVKQEFPKLLIVTLAVGALFYDLMFQQFDGMVLLALLGAYLLLLFLSGRSAPVESVIDLDEIPDTNDTKLPKLAAWFVVALIALLASSRLLVWAATNVAQSLGVDDVIIGLTIVAIGTSLPELAAAIASALKKQHDMVLGNVIGSNVLNLLTVLPLPALISPTVLAGEVLNRDYLVMLATTAAVAAFAYASKRHQLNRLHGACLLISYVAYLAFLYWKSVAV